VHTDAFEVYWIGLQELYGLTNASTKRLEPEMDLVTSFPPPTPSSSDDEVSTVASSDGLSTVEGPGSVSGATNEDPPQCQLIWDVPINESLNSGHFYKAASHPLPRSNASEDDEDDGEADNITSDDILPAADSKEAEAANEMGDLPGSSAGAGPSGVTDDARTNDKDTAAILGKRPGGFRTAKGSTRQSGSASRRSGGVKKPAATKKPAVPRKTPATRNTRAAPARGRKAASAQGSLPDIQEEGVPNDNNNTRANAPPNHPRTGGKSIPPPVAPRGTKRKAAGGGEEGRGREKRRRGV
jgi:hypothetical protein